ncbi:hypothetical protein MMC07_003200 [Pseudocyphellaria aurata]|nr:hypothetical protein [Pseudocyphellaria aurata]
MTENASVFDQVLNDQRTSAKHRWRGKLFSTEGKLKKNVEASENSDHDLSDFLHPAGNTTGSRITQDLPPTRLDTSAARRWPSAAEVLQTTTKSTDRPRKPPRKTGLHVTFESSPPEVIGEGGDEAELPATAVSRRRRSAQPGSLSTNGAVVEAAISSQPSQQDKQPSLVTDQYALEEDETFRPPLLQRRPTGLDKQPNGGDFDFADHDTRLKSSYMTVPVSSNSSLRDRLENAEPCKDRDSGDISPGIVKETVPARGSHSPRPTPRSAVSDVVPLLQVPSFDLGLSGLSWENSLTPIPSPKPPPLPNNLQLSNRQSQSITTDYFESSHTREPNAVPQTDSQKAEETSKSIPEARAFSIRDVAIHLGDDALNDFASRVQRFSDLFQIGATVTAPVMDIPFAQWIRTSAYWFLKGRGELENAVRKAARTSQGFDPEQVPEVSHGLRQAYLDLAKSWWIMEKITPNHPEPRKYGKASLASLFAVVQNLGDLRLAELIGVHLGIAANMRALTMSMKRNNRLPPVSFEIQGLETRIFVEFPKFPSNVAVALLERSRASTMKDPHDIEPFFPIPVGDTKRHFIYSSVIVDLLYTSLGDNSQDIRLPCVLSVLRERTDWDLKAVIASQDGKVNLQIQSDKNMGLTWDKVSWKIKSNSLRVKLSDKVDIDIQFWEKDFKSLWGIHEYTRKVQEGLRGRKGEQEIFNDKLKSFQNTDQQNSKNFPSEQIKGCSLRLFERRNIHLKGAVESKTHGGFRVMVVTPPGIKTLSNINLDLDKRFPILFSYLRGEDASPALLLKISDPSSESSMLMTFYETTSRGEFHSLIDGTSVASNETCSQPLPLDSFSILETSVTGLPSIPGQNFVNALRWQQLRVIKRCLDSPSHTAHSVLPEDLRIWTDCETGSFVDRMNFGPGEMQISLCVDLLPELRILRHRHADATFSFSKNKISKEDTEALCRKLQSLASSSTILYFRFHTLTDLHRYQASLTGFHVMFDGTASSFSISRRRMVVPIYKRWEVNFARLQILKQNRVLQLVGFFRDFAHGTCMNFVLKSTDVFESLARSGIYYIRIVDAKFALPKIGDEANKDFVCLDIPEYPGEHDDITIGFEVEAGMQNLLLH